MALQDNLYHITAQTTLPEGEGGGAVYRIALHPDSAIYRAHFPSRPITPGACMIQIVEELARRYFADATLQVRSITNLKFLALLEPHDHPCFDVLLRGTPTHLQATFRDGSLIFARLTLALFSITNYRIEE